MGDARVWFHIFSPLQRKEERKTKQKEKSVQIALVPYRQTAIRSIASNNNSNDNTRNIQIRTMLFT